MSSNSTYFYGSAETFYATYVAVELLLCLICLNCGITDMLKKADEIFLKLPGLESQRAHAMSQPQLNHTILLDHSYHSPTSLLAGSSLSLHTVQLIDINTKQLLLEAGGREGNTGNERTVPLHSLAFVGAEGHVFVTCSGEEASIKLWDIRENPKACGTMGEHGSFKLDTMTSPSQCSYALAVSRVLSMSDAKVAVLGSGGQMFLYDTRNREAPIAKCCVKQGDDSSAFRSRFSTGRALYPCIQVRKLQYAHI